MGIKNSHLIFFVKDQQKSAVYYSSVLNMKPRLDVPGMTEFDLGSGTVLGLMPEQGIKNLLGDAIEDPASANGVPRSELYLQVDDARSYHQRSVENGGIALSALELRNWGDQVAYSSDPDGHILAFAEKGAMK